MSLDCFFAWVGSWPRISRIIGSFPPSTFGDISTLRMLGGVVLVQGQQIATLESKHEETEKLALQKALQHGVFAREDLDEIPVFFCLEGGLRLEVWI